MIDQKLLMLQRLTFVNPTVIIALGFTKVLFRLNITILDSIILTWEK